MQVIYSKGATEDRAYWKKSNPNILKRIDLLLADIKRNPYTGIGKPERIRFEKSGYWSRRIDQEHRLVYKVVNHKIYIVQCRYHY
jgi:toxin YoeB